jgi:hypothetical protein
LLWENKPLAKILGIQITTEDLKWSMESKAGMKHLKLCDKNEVCENFHLFLAWEITQLSCTVKLATSLYHYARQILPSTQYHSPPMIHQREKRHLQPCIKVILKLFLATRSKKNKRRNIDNLYELWKVLTP